MRDGSVGKMHKYENSNLHPHNHQNEIQATRHILVIPALGASLAALGSARDSATINRQINRRKTPDSRLPVHVWESLSLTCHHVPHMNTHLKIEEGSLYLYANPTPRTSWVSSESPFGERRNEAPQDIPAASLLLKLCFRRFCVFRQGPL